MNQNQLTKLKGRFLNMLTQLGGAPLALGNTTEEQQVKTKVLQATALVKEALDMCDKIQTREVTQAEQKKAWKKKQIPDYPATEVVVIRHDPTVKPTYNLLCHNYTEVRAASGKVLERGCIVGMDMDYCSKNCAYATNNVCSLKAKGAKWKK